MKQKRNKPPDRLMRTSWGNGVLGEERFGILDLDTLQSVVMLTLSFPRKF